MNSTNCNSYPLQPNIVILSYYLNDIDYLLADTDRNPDNNFTFPQNPAAAGSSATFFLPNYIYYDLLQFTSIDARDQLRQRPDQRAHGRYAVGASRCRACSSSSPGRAIRMPA